jgi:hypothetical protein
MSTPFVQSFVDVIWLAVELSDQMKLKLPVTNSALLDGAVVSPHTDVRAELELTSLSSSFVLKVLAEPPLKFLSMYTCVAVVVVYLKSFVTSASAVGALATVPAALA